MGFPFQILINMFLILLATTELKDFFAKARNGSVRLIKIVIEDGKFYIDFVLLSFGVSFFSCVPVVEKQDTKLTNKYFFTSLIWLPPVNLGRVGGWPRATQRKILVEASGMKYLKNPHNFNFKRTVGFILIWSIFGCQ